MNYFYRIVLLCVWCTAGFAAAAQQSASDTLRPSASGLPPQASGLKPDSSGLIDTLKLIQIPAYTPVQRHAQFQQVLHKHPLYAFAKKPVQLLMQKRDPKGDEFMFYLLLALVLYYALVRAFFYRYHGNLFTLFFRATLRQQQLREQLLQTPLPSLLLNLLFIVSGALYISFLAGYYGVAPRWNSVELVLYAIAALSIIYLGKFVILKTVGWIIRMHKATDAYIFVVFMVNKVAGVCLLPVLFLLAFPVGNSNDIVVPGSVFAVFLLLAYRFLISYRQVRSEIKVNPFHFFLYLCAFEIAPLLLIYKVLLNIVERTI